MHDDDALLRARYTEALVRTGRKLRTSFNARVVAHGLTYPRARALLVLEREGQLTQSDLAAELELEGPTVVRLLDGMEKLDLIERKAVQGDRRAKHIALTDHGRHQAGVVAEISLELRNEILEGTSASDLEAGLRILERIGRAIGEETRHGD